uniref:Uncharacterized protein n=1 Tax=Peronospora matthiolae TaxID=2874970 RepID=A0AAV1UGG9_9STRA
MFKQLAVRLRNLARCSLSLRSSSKGSISIQLGIDILVQSRVYIVLGNQDAGSTIARAHHRLWTRKIRSAGSWNAYWVTRALVATRSCRDFMSARFQPRASIVYVGSIFQTSRINLVDDLSFLVVSENETNDDSVVVKRHLDCEKVVVKRHRDDEMKNDDENVVLNVYRNHHANETSYRACGTTTSRTRVVSLA